MARLKNGDILQIPLPQDLGFAYARYIDLLKIVPKPGLPDLVKVFDYKTKDKHYNFEELQNSDYLIAPLLVTGLPPTIRKGLWNILKEKATKDDFEIPHFSRHEDWAPGSPDDNWYYCLEASALNKVKTTYDKVKHLSPLVADGTGVIEIEIAMTYLIKEGKRVEDYFELKEYYEKATYEKVKNTPYYSLPKDIRNKAIDSIHDTYNEYQKPQNTH